MSDKKIKCLSRRSVICNECGENLDRYDYLKQHFERKHPGKPCMARGQSSISTFVSVGTKRKVDAFKSSEDDRAHAPGYGTHYELSSIQPISINDDPSQISSISSIESPSLNTSSTPHPPPPYLPSDPSTSKDEPQLQVYHCPPPTDDSNICQ